MELRDSCHLLYVSKAFWKVKETDIFNFDNEGAQLMRVLWFWSWGRDVEPKAQKNNKDVGMILSHSNNAAIFQMWNLGINPLSKGNYALLVVDRLRIDTIENVLGENRLFSKPKHTHFQTRYTLDVCF